jgi:hypothetical protein
MTAGGRCISCGAIPLVHPVHVGWDCATLVGESAWFQVKMLQTNQLIWQGNAVSLIINELNQQKTNRRFGLLGLVVHKRNG